MGMGSEERKPSLEAPSLFRRKRRAEAPAPAEAEPAEKSTTPPPADPGQVDGGGGAAVVADGIAVPDGVEVGAPVEPRPATRGPRTAAADGARPGPTGPSPAAAPFDRGPEPSDETAGDGETPPAGAAASAVAGRTDTAPLTVATGSGTSEPATSEEGASEGQTSEPGATPVDAAPVRADLPPAVAPMGVAASTPPPGAKTPRAPREPLNGHLAAALTGVVVGVFLVLATAGGLEGCTAVRGTSSCGGGPGFLVLLLIVTLAVAVGTACLRWARVGSAGSISFLAVALTSVVSVLFLLDALDSAGGVVAVGVVTVASYALSHWVTVRYIDTVT